MNFAFNNNLGLFSYWFIQQGPGSLMAADIGVLTLCSSGIYICKSPRCGVNTSPQHWLNFPLPECVMWIDFLLAGQCTDQDVSGSYMGDWGWGIA